MAWSPAHTLLHINHSDEFECRLAIKFDADTQCPRSLAPSPSRFGQFSRTQFQPTGFIRSARRFAENRCVCVCRLANVATRFVSLRLAVLSRLLFTASAHTSRTRNAVHSIRSGRFSVAQKRRAFAKAATFARSPQVGGIHSAAFAALLPCRLPFPAFYSR